MYRTDGTDSLQKIERLERELNLAYEEQFPTANDADVGLALLRFRAQRLARDIDSFREKHQREPLWKRWKKKVTRVGLGFGFVAGAGLVAMTWGARSLVSHAPGELAEGYEAHETPPPAEITEPAVAVAPVATLEPVTIAEPEATPEPPAAPEPAAPEATRVPMSPRDYQEMLAHSLGFFRAIAKRDGEAIARLAHPRNGLTLGDESLSLTPALLRDCFTNRHLHTIPVSAAAEDTEQKTCGDILSFYAQTPYARSPDVLFNALPGPVEANGVAPASAPYVFFYLPANDENTADWQGVSLAFARYGRELVLVGVHRQYWTP